MIWRRSPSKEDDSMSFTEAFLSKTKMAAENVSKRQQRMLESRENFRTNAFLLINEILELSEEHSVPLELVDEALHSIFFLGKINKISPESIFANNTNILNALKQSYPKPFELFSSQLPKRHPMSCVLDMIVRVIGQRNEDNIKQKLQQINNKLKRGYKDKFLISSTMCVSQNTDVSDSDRYYGVSMSTSGGCSRDIMIAASCCIYWDGHVADAVMTYYPDRNKKDYFDGTIRVPKKVRCQAFSIPETLGKKPPCESCKNLFGLRTNFAYGNCAEVESVSNLFKNEIEIKAQSQPRSDTYTAESRKNAQRFTLTKLKSYLNGVKFEWDNKFYPNLEYEIYQGS